METAERILSRKDHCPKCGNATMILKQCNDQVWFALCANCGAGPAEPTMSKRQAETAWRLFARGEEDDL